MSKKARKHHTDKSEIIKRRLIGIFIVVVCLGIIFLLISNSFEKKPTPQPISNLKLGRFDKVFLEGLDAEHEQDFDRALLLYKIALELNPNEPKVWLRISDVYNLMHSPGKAIDALKQAIKLQPTEANLYSKLKDIYQVIKQPEEALIAIGQAVLLDPTNVGYLWDQGKIAEEVHDLEQAKKSYQQILKILPEDEKALAALAEIERLELAAKTENVPPSPLQQGLAAEGRKEWDKAIGIYKEMLLLKPDQPLIWKRMADIEIFLKRYANAAVALTQAIKYQPNNINLYRDLADTYAANKEPEKAYCVVEKALQLAPNNLSMWIKLASYATELKYYNVADEAYQFVLCVKPNHKEALLGVAQLLVAQNKLDAAVSAYEYYLCHYPDSKSVWIDFAKVQSWRGNLAQALNIIEMYRLPFGETEEYWKTKARLLAMSIYPKESLCVLETELADKTNDYDVLFTKVVALNGNNERCRAIQELDWLTTRFPDHKKDNEELAKFIKTPVRSNVNIKPYFYNDSTQVDGTGLQVHGQFFITPETSFQLGHLHETLRAPVGSGLESYDGHSSVWDAAQWVGLKSQVFPELELGAIAGVCEIQRKASFFTYDVKALIQPCEKYEFVLVKGRNLFANSSDVQNSRVLYAISPKSVSLRVIQYYNQATINLKGTRAYLSATAEYDTFSDSNTLGFLSISPTVSLLNSQYVNFSLGMYGVYYSFKERLDRNGYYSPREYQLYQATGTATVKVNDNINLVFGTAIGQQKDETMPQAQFAGDLSFRADVGLYQDWQLSLAAYGIKRESPIALYKQYMFYASLKRRF